MAKELRFNRDARRLLRPAYCAMSMRSAVAPRR
jgi:hypothetical protein